MPGYIGLYLHGFLSSGNSQKGQWFKSRVDEMKCHDVPSLFMDWLTPTYPIGQVSESITSIERVLFGIQGFQKKVVLLGSSMGGFYAQYFSQKYGLPAILINPALNPETVFYQNLGTHTNPATGERVTIDQHYIEELMKYHCNDLDKQVPSMLLMDTDDEVIDVPYALQLYSKQNDRHQCVTFSGGDHSFVHLPEAWHCIYEFVSGLDDIAEEKK